jgi:hypothetical protein
MSRVLLWTAPDRFTGEMAAEELRDAGLPVHTAEPLIGTDMYPSPILEVWLEDEELLNDPEIREKIDEVIGSPPLKEEDADVIAAMPFQDVQEKPLLSPGVRMVLIWAGGICLLGLAVVLAAIAIPR